MAANLAEIVVASANTALSVLALQPQAMIGALSVQASIEETYEDTVQVTEHPVEQGAEISDHAFNRPTQATLRVGWSNASTQALLNSIANVIAGGSITGSDYVGSIYSQLLAMQQALQPVTVTTGARTLQNMMITGVHRTRDKTTSQVLMVTATLRQVIIVSTQNTTLPSQDNQASPADTAEQQNVGTSALQPGNPSPGGAVPYSDWTGGPTPFSAGATFTPYQIPLQISP